MTKNYRRFVLNGMVGAERNNLVAVIVDEQYFLCQFHLLYAVCRLQKKITQRSCAPGHFRVYKHYHICNLSDTNKRSDSHSPLVASGQCTIACYLILRPFTYLCWYQLQRCQSSEGFR